MHRTTGAAIKKSRSNDKFSARNEQNGAVVFSTTLLAMLTLDYLLKTRKNLYSVAVSTVAR